MYAFVHSVSRPNTLLINGDDSDRDSDDDEESNTTASQQQAASIAPDASSPSSPAASASRTVTYNFMFYGPVYNSQFGDKHVMHCSTDLVQVCR